MEIQEFGLQELTKSEIIIISGGGKIARDVSFWIAEQCAKLDTWMKEKCSASSTAWDNIDPYYYNFGSK